MLGDFRLSQVIDYKFSTNKADGTPVTLSGSPAISIYKTNDTTQSTSGVTLTTDFDGVTGLNHVRIDTSASATFYTPGADFQIVITTGTVDGTSVVGTVLEEFSIDNRIFAAIIHSGIAAAGAASTVTLAAGASATNDIYVGELIVISSGTGAGQARIITAYNGTTKVATVDRNFTTNPGVTSVYFIIATDLAKLDSSLQVTTTSSGITTADVRTQCGLALSDINLDQLLFTAATLSTDVDINSVMGQLMDNGTAWTYNRSTDSLEAIRDDIDSQFASLITIIGGGAPTAGQVADAVWDELQSGHTTPGSFGFYLDAAISSRMATFTLPANFSALLITSGGIVTANTTLIEGVDATYQLDAHAGPTLAAILAGITSDHGSGSYVDTGPGGDATIANQVAILAAIDDASEPVYHADIELRINSTAGNDGYRAIWFKNGVEPQTATGVTIQVVKPDGTDLIAQTAMTAVGDTWVYTATGASRITAGNIYKVIVSGTIDGNPRRFSRNVERDA